MSRAVLSLGSNLGDRAAHLRSALPLLGGPPVALSAVYETAPWGGVEQDPFLNAVVILDDTAADAPTWLERAFAAERAAARVREVRWGPRTLDVDVLDVDGQVRTEEALTLPHPRAHERAFVLVPWLEADPAAVITGRGAVADLLAALPAAERAGVRAVAGMGLR